MDELVVCAVCHGPWHQATGMLVGTPQSYPMCGRCWPEAMRAFRAMTCRKPSKRARHQCEFYGSMPGGVGDTWFVVEVRDAYGWRYADYARYTTRALAEHHMASMSETRELRVIEREAENTRRTF